MSTPAWLKLVDLFDLNWTFFPLDKTAPEGPLNTISSWPKLICWPSAKMAPVSPMMSTPAWLKLVDLLDLNWMFLPLSRTIPAGPLSTTFPCPKLTCCPSAKIAPVSPIMSTPAWLKLVDLLLLNWTWVPSDRISPEGPSRATFVPASLNWICWPSAKRAPESPMRWPVGVRALFFLNWMFLPLANTIPEGPARTKPLAWSWVNWMLFPSGRTTPESPTTLGPVFDTGTAAAGPTRTLVNATNAKTATVSFISSFDAPSELLYDY